MPRRMASEEIKPQPDIQTVEQDSEDWPSDVGLAGAPGYPFGVRIVGPVETQELPAMHTATRSLTIPVGQDPQLVFAPNPRRKSVALWIENGDIYFSEQQSMVRASQSGGYTGAHLVSGGTVTIDHQDAVWVTAPTTAVLLSYIMELWSD